MKKGDSAPDFKMDLVSGTSSTLYLLLDSGPAVLNFIMGTWCPFCDRHLQKIRKWQDQLGKSTTMVIISSESKQALLEWLAGHPCSYLFVSDPELEIIKQYGVKNKIISTATPATVLVDADKSIQMFFTGVRTENSRAKMLETIKEK